jgi:plastocyanin
MQGPVDPSGPASPKASCPPSLAADQATPTPAAPAVRDITLRAEHLKWNAKTLEVKSGEKLKITIVNTDDEKHNFVNLSHGLLPMSESPDVSGGQTTSFTWTVPNAPGVYTFFCIYHPAMTIETTIK